jgi:hypothetical protein
MQCSSDHHVCNQQRPETTELCNSARLLSEAGSAHVRYLHDQASR